MMALQEGAAIVRSSLSIIQVNINPSTEQSRFFPPPGDSDHLTTVY